MSDNLPASPASARMDKWLWAVRLFKTRSLASAACKNGAVEVNQQKAKPARNVRLDETIQIRMGNLLKTVRVAGLTEKRVGAKLVPQFLTDLTPPEEYEKAKASQLSEIAPRPRGAGRPTKKERRALERLF